jgi:hypothetical protein
MISFLPTNRIKWQCFEFVFGSWSDTMLSETPTSVTDSLCGLPWSSQVNVDVAPKMVGHVSQIDVISDSLFVNHPLVRCYIV